MRRYGLTATDIERIVSAPVCRDTDSDGRPRFVAAVGARRFSVVLALDDPDLVVTVDERRS